MARVEVMARAIVRLLGDGASAAVAKARKPDGSVPSGAVYRSLPPKMRASDDAGEVFQAATDKLDGVLIDTQDTVYRGQSWHTLRLRDRTEG